MLKDEQGFKRFRTHVILRGKSRWARPTFRRRAYCGGICLQVARLQYFSHARLSIIYVSIYFLTAFSKICLVSRAAFGLSSEAAVDSLESNPYSLRTSFKTTLSTCLINVLMRSYKKHTQTSEKYHSKLFAITNQTLSY